MTGRKGPDLLGSEGPVPPVPTSPWEDEARELMVALDDMKFAAAHFVAYRGFREPLHGHNYTVSLRVGGRALQRDGYLADFSDLKKEVRRACDALNHCTLLPLESDVLEISGQGSGQVDILCEDGSRMSLPESDCRLLPIAHTTVEELSEFLWWDILAAQGLAGRLMSRGVRWLEVRCFERPRQGSRYRAAVALASASGARKPSVARAPPQPCISFSAGACGAAPVSSSELQPYTSPGSSGAHEQSAVARLDATLLDEVAVGEEAFRLLLSTLGPEQAAREELRRTPYRAAKAFREMTAGLKVQDPKTVIGKGLFHVEEAQDLVAIRDMPFHSMCEHHLLPFSGTAHVAYMPNGRVLGLSKFPRLLDVIARRPQLQERLSADFANAVQELLEPRAVAVALEATHGCMCHRGVGVGASTRTLVLRGPECKDGLLRADLLDAVSFAQGSTRPHARL